MQRPAPITYRDFYDVPRLFMVREEERMLLFDSRFDPARDEYDEAYTVYILPPLTENEIGGDWTQLPSKALHCLGRVAVAEVKFDHTRRKQVDLAILSELNRY